MNSSQLWETALDPEKRELIQLTTEDLEKELEIFDILHGKQCRKERNDMMMKFKINLDDIDT